MNRYLLLYATAATLLLGLGVRHLRDARAEIRRLTETQTALSDRAELFRNRAGEAAAATQVLRLRCAEFERLRAEDAARIRRLGIRIRRLEAAATSVARTTIDTAARLRDTVILHRRDTIRLRDTVRLFRWRDAWVTIDGLVAGDSVRCRIESVDTLRQVVHRIPRRFLFIRWGTKALRQEIASSNPHTLIVYTEYIRTER